MNEYTSLDKSAALSRPGTEVFRTREVFRSLDGRYLGTETETTEQYRGYDGMYISQRTTDTRQFHSEAEMRDWRSQLHRELDVERVAANGGTKLVIVV